MGSFYLAAQTPTLLIAQRGPYRDRVGWAGECVPSFGWFIDQNLSRIHRLGPWARRNLDAQHANRDPTIRMRRLITNLLTSNVEAPLDPCRQLCRKISRKDLIRWGAVQEPLLLSHRWQNPQDSHSTGRSARGPERS